MPSTCASYLQALLKCCFFPKNTDLTFLRCFSENLLTYPSACADGCQTCKEEHGTGKKDTGLGFGSLGTTSCRTPGLAC